MSANIDKKTPEKQGNIKNRVILAQGNIENRAICDILPCS